MTAFLRDTVLLFLMAMSAAALAQTTVTLRDGLNGYAGTRDVDPLSAFADTTRGSVTVLNTNHNTSAVLLRFKIFASEGGPVPNDATITSATLSLYKYEGPTSVYEARRLLKDWQEMEATWNVAASALPWQTAGALGSADIASSADSQATAPDIGWFNLNVTASVQAFASGTPNNGWRLGWLSGTTGTKSFYSRDNAQNPSLRPTLTITYTGGCTSGPYGGTAWPAGEVEAENFDCGGEGVGYHDTTPGNQQGSTYRPGESVDVWDIPAGGRTVRDFNTGEWMAYTINVPAGTYALAVSAAHNATPGQYRIEIDGNDVTGNVSVPGTGSWDVYQWVQAPGTVSLTAGQHVVRLISALEAYRVDKIRIEPTTPVSCEDPPQRPFTAAIQIPATGATFEAENFDCGGEGTAYHDTTTGNQLGTFRAEESVDVWDIPTGGQVVRNFDSGEWMEYTVNVATAGSYRLGIMAGHNATPGLYRIEVDGIDATGDVTVPSTGSWDVYEWFDSTNTVNLTAGTHVLRLVSVQQHFRVEKLRVMPASTSGACSPNPDFLHSFENSMSENGAYTLQQAAPGRIVLVDTPHRHGSKAIKFTTSGGDTNVNGSGNNMERAELRMGTALTDGVEGRVQWWAHSTYFPDNFQFPTADDMWDASLFAQWHDSDDSPDNGGQPNLAAEIVYEGGTTPGLVMRFRLTHSGGDVRRYAFNRAPPQKNVWYDFIYHVKWSSGSTGFAKVWVRKAGDAQGQLVMDYTGPTLYPNNGVYFKIGTYHFLYPNAPGSVIHDCVAKGGSVDEIRWFPLQGVP